MKTYQIRAYNTVEGEYFDGEIEAENRERAISLAKIEYCFPPSSHMCNVKIKSCKELKNESNKI